MRQFARTTMAAVVLVASLVGCARFEFDLVEPADLSQRIGRQGPATVAVDPFRYRMQAVDGRLVIFIDNPTDRAITLLGVESAAVPADGVSRPLPSFTIAPQSSGRLTLPPLQPQVTPTGPTMSMGVGMGMGSGGRRSSNVGVGMSSGGSRSVVVSDPAGMLWEWSGQTQVRLLLRFRDGDQTFEQQFVFHRRRV